MSEQAKAYRLVDEDAVLVINGQTWHWTPEDGWRNVDDPGDGDVPDLARTLKPFSNQTKQIVNECPVDYAAIGLGVFPFDLAPFGRVCYNVMQIAGKPRDSVF